jgi:beta-glucosidase
MKTANNSNRAPVFLAILAVFTCDAADMPTPPAPNPAPKVDRGELDAGRNDGTVASSKPTDLIYPPSYDECMKSGKPVSTRKQIYKEGWIDLNKNGRKDVYEDPAQPVEKRVEDLLSQMNTDEKTAQMATLYGYKRVVPDYLPVQAWKSALWKDGIGNIDEHLNAFNYWKDDVTKVPGLAFVWPASKHAWALNEVQRFFIEETRLGIPVDFTDEGIRGVEAFKATSFPTQLGVGQTWNRALVFQMGRVTGREAKALGFTNVYCPIMDIIRDQRWGRCEESYGEDPFLAAELGIAMAKGVQTQQVVATAKHFAIYSDNKGAREGFARSNPQCSWREAELLHLYPFERVIKEAGILGVMSSYNDYDGIPVQGSHFLLDTILRKRMGFKGYVVSDSGAVEWMHEKHATSKDMKDSVRQSVLAGLNIRTTFDSPTNYVNPLRQLIKEGDLPMTLVDERVREILRVKFWQGTFDSPYRDLPQADQTVCSAEHHQIGKEISYQSLVLLKNENETLPLDLSRVKRIALCGFNAADDGYARGHYGPLAGEISTVFSALSRRCKEKGIQLLHARGCDPLCENQGDLELMWEPPTAVEQKMIDEAAANAAKADVSIVVVGDRDYGCAGELPTCGENASRNSLNLTGRQDDLIKAVAKAAAGKPLVIVQISGRPNALNWANRLSPAILQAFFPGAEGGNAIVDALLGDYNPGGHLTVTFPKSAGQLKLNFPSYPGAQGGETHLTQHGPLWAFGHGLSYTTFEFSNLKIGWGGKAEGKKATASTPVQVSCEVKNSGGRNGETVVQLYTRDTLSSVITFEKNLRGFERIKLAPGETKTVTFTLNPREHLWLFDQNMKKVVEPGEFKIMVGDGSANRRSGKKGKAVEPHQPGIRLRGKLEICEEVGK